MCLPKHCLVFVNVSFLILSIVLLNIGAIIQASLVSNYHLFNEHLGAPAALTIFFGALLSFMALLALLSVYCRSHCLLSVYICSLVVLVVIELSLGIAGFLTRSHALSLIGDSLRLAESRFTSDHFAGSTWNSVQRELKCCGVNNYEEWFSYLGNSSVPDSCCTLYAIDCGKVALKAGNFYPTSCASAISKWAENNGIYIAILVTFIIIFQLLSLFLSILTKFSSLD